MVFINRHNTICGDVGIYVLPAAILFMVLGGIALGDATMRPAGHYLDIEYGQAGGERLLLDAFVPEEEGPRPVVILVHGGGWSSGDKSEMDFVFEPLSQAGFTWFSINYRLAPKHRWPACLDDVNAAIVWVKQHAAEYNGDPNRIALAGYSAGGHLACLAAVLATPRTRVQTVVGFAAPTDMEADTARRGGLSPSLQNLFGRPKEVDETTRRILCEISPINYIKAPMGPFLLIHGTTDKSVPYSQSINFQAKLREQGISCELVTVPGAPHRISDWDKFGVDFTGQVIEWLGKTLDK